MAILTVEHICNMALDILVEAPITSIDEDTKPARLLKRHFETTRQAELTKHAWSFAIFREELTAIDSGSMPDGETYTYGYELPADALRVLPLTDTGEAHGVSIPWKLEGTLLLTNYEGPRLVRYIANLTDPDDWDALFVEALAARLAMKIALALTGKPTMLQAAERAYRDTIGTAKQTNAIQTGSIARSLSWHEERGDYDYAR
jgi:hypothetical protein